MMTDTRLWRTLWFLATAAVAIAIAILTLSGPGPMPTGFQMSDKFYHASAFAALVLPTALLWRKRLTPIAFGAVTYGVLIELVQPYMGRTAEVGDIVANTIGVGLALLVGAIAAAIRLKPQ
jgi:VanZ family protein